MDWDNQQDDRVVRLRGGFNEELFKSALAKLKDFKTVCYLLERFACVIWHSPTLFFYTQKARQEAKAQSAAGHDTQEVETNLDLSAADIILDSPQSNGGPLTRLMEDSASATSAGPTEADDVEILQFIQAESPARTTTTTRAPHSAPGGFVYLVCHICVSCLLV